MKKWCVIVILFLFLFAPFFAVAQNVPSQIKEVTLFSKQALVKREAFAQIQKGLNELFLEIQAYHVDRDSLSAAVFGDGEIFSVQFKEIPLKESPREKILALEEKIKKLKKSKRILSDKKEELNKNDAFLCSLINFAKIQVPREIKTSFPKIEDLTQTLAFLNSNFQKISAEKQSIDASIEETDKEIKVLKQELDALQVPGKKNKKVIEVLFNSKREQNIHIQASYLTQNAS